MGGFWCWFGNNSSQVQAIAGVFTVLVAMALGYVAIRQARAADAQAGAARLQAEAAVRQIKTSILIADKQTSPHFSITAAQTREGVLRRNTIAIRNNGSGGAAGLKFEYRDGAVGNEIALGASVLVVGDSIPVPFDEARGAQSGFRLTYSTIFGSRYALEFRWNGRDSNAVDERLVLLVAAWEADSVFNG
jgi:hypothetical protein